MRANRSTPVNRQPAPGAQPAMELHIESLVLHGFNASPNSLKSFAGALARELEQRLAGGGFGAAQSQTLAKALAPTVALPASELNAGAARIVARAVVSHLSVTASGGITFPNAAHSRTAPNQTRNHKPANPYAKT